MIFRKLFVAFDFVEDYLRIVIMFSISTSQQRLRSGLAAQAGVYAAHLETMNPSAVVPTSKRLCWFGIEDRRGRLMR
jgi:hypothetical protein